MLVFQSRSFTANFDLGNGHFLPKKRFKDTLKASLKWFDIDLTNWDIKETLGAQLSAMVQLPMRQIVFIMRSWKDSKESPELLVSLNRFIGIVPIKFWKQIQLFAVGKIPAMTVSWPSWSLSQIWEEYTYIGLSSNLLTTFHSLPSAWWSFTLVALLKLAIGHKFIAVGHRK